MGNAQETMMNNDETEWLRQRMAHVRHHLADDVVGVVEQAKDLTDWRSYVRRHPWLCTGAAVALGFMIVPTRRAPAPLTGPVSHSNGHNSLGSMSHRAAPQSTAGALLQLVAGMAVRSLVSVAGQQLQNMLVARSSHEPNAPSAHWNERR